MGSPNRKLTPQTGVPPAKANHPAPSEPNHDQPESVWSYPRPPRLEPTPRRITITHKGQTLANSTQALRILETSHPPVYYIPPSDIALSLLTPSSRRGSFCEFKGTAAYWSLKDAPNTAPPVAWSYPNPTPAYAALKNHLAFYASRVDTATVDGEPAQPQPGDFYGGWITSHITGPFKGPPGTLGW